MLKPRDERSGAAPRTGSPAAPTGSQGASLSFLVDGPYLRNLRTTVSETYASLAANQEGASAAIEKTIAAVARVEVPLDPQFKGELIARLGELLAKLDKLNAMLPKGERSALESLDRATALLRQIGSQTKG